MIVFVFTKFLIGMQIIWGLLFKTLAHWSEFPSFLSFKICIGTKKTSHTGQRSEQQSERFGKKKKSD